MDTCGFTPMKEGRNKIKSQKLKIKNSRSDPPARAKRRAGKIGAATICSASGGLRSDPQKGRKKTANLIEKMVQKSKKKQKGWVTKVMAGLVLHYNKIKIDTKNV